MTPTISIDGELEGFYETGTEGVIWSLWDNTKSGYDGLHYLQPGDHFVIYAHDGTVAWEGDILWDRQVGRITAPTNPNYRGQAALGMWVHGIQQGFEPDAWATFFFQSPPLRGRLSKKE